MIGLTNAIEDINSKYSQIINYKMLYDYGDECIDVTGGWDTYNKNLYNYYSSANMATKNQTFINVTTSGSGKRTYSLFTNSFINVTEFSNIFIKNSWLKLTGSNKGASWVMLSDEPTNGEGSNYLRKLLHGRGGNVTVNTNNETATYYHCINLNELDSSLIQPSLSSVSLGFVWDYENTGSELNSSVFACAILKQDNWQELCTIAGLNSSDYTDEAELCANSTAIQTLLSNEEAVEFMIYNCTGEFMAKAITSDTFLTVLNNSEYKTKIYANEHWAKFLNMVA